MGHTIYPCPVQWALYQFVTVCTIPVGGNCGSWLIRAVLALDALPMLEAKAKERQGERNDRTLLNSLSNVDRNDNTATAQAATLTGTNRQYVNDAARIR